jgi:hypothetical protein
LNKPFVEKVGATFPIALDDQKLSRSLFKIQGTPTNFVIDRQGRIIFRHLGFGPGSEEVLKAEIEMLGRPGGKAVTADPDQPLKRTPIGRRGPRMSTMRAALPDGRPRGFRIVRRTGRREHPPSSPCRS